MLNAKCNAAGGYFMPCPLFANRKADSMIAASGELGVTALLHTANTAASPSSTVSSCCWTPSSRPSSVCLTNAVVPLDRRALVCRKTAAKSSTKHCLRMLVVCSRRYSRWTSCWAL